MTLGLDTVITREVDYLITTGDSLPTLVKANLQDTTAPFDTIEAYWPSPLPSKRAVYVTRDPYTVLPFDTGFSISRHQMRLKVRWPIQGNLQACQQALDSALDLLVQRVAGPLGQKTHGSRFMSAAVGNIAVTPRSDPERETTALRVDVTYVIDDQELAI